MLISTSEVLVHLQNKFELVRRKKTSFLRKRKYCCVKIVGRKIIYVLHISLEKRSASHSLGGLTLFVSQVGGMYIVRIQYVYVLLTWAYLQYVTFCAFLSPLSLFMLLQNSLQSKIAFLSNFTDSDKRTFECFQVSIFS